MKNPSRMLHPHFMAPRRDFTAGPERPTLTRFRNRSRSVAPEADPRTDRVIGVLVVTPHRLEGEVLRLAVEQDGRMRVVGVEDGADTAVFKLQPPGPDVVVLGWGWKGHECLELLRAFRAEREGVPILVISADTRVTHIRQAIEAGARGFLPGSVDLDDLLHAIRTAARHHQVEVHRSLAPALLAHVAARSVPTASPVGYDSLTRREQEVVGLLAHGLTDRDLAQELFISVRTVQTHLAHIYAKLGVHTRTELALLAVREGWATHSAGGARGEST